MKKIKLLPVLILALVAGTNVFGQNKATKKGFAVLELFTSEGCSSCPPADELMGKIQKEHMDSEVYVLSYHVDYWDKQGWKDVFSDADYTKRQYEYLKWLGSSVYTPQLIINGKVGLIGSEETAVRNATKKALSMAATADVTLKAVQSGNKITVSHSVNGASKNSRLLLAIVQKTAQSSVKRGENANRILSHFQIVHHLHSTALAGNEKGTTTLTLPKGFTTKGFEIIGFVQDSSSGAILGATKATF